jgi:uncharacterized protein (DUF4415 family)
MAKKKAAKKTRKITHLRASASGGKSLPDLGPEWQRYYKVLKEPVTLRLDADVLAWFKKQGRGYQTRINKALRKVMADEKRANSGSFGRNKHAP